MVSKRRDWTSQTLKLATIVVALGGSFCLESCCAFRATRYGTVLGTFEKYVIVGYDEQPCCPVPGERIPRLLAPSEPIKVWVRAVYRDQINKPVKDVTVTFGLVDSFGTNIPITSPGFSINPQTVQTASDGYSLVPITFVTSQQGHYHIKAAYKDKDADGISYGPLLIVQR